MASKLRNHPLLPAWGNQHLLTGLLGALIVGTLLASAMLVTRVASRHAVQTNPDVARKQAAPMPVALHTVAHRTVVERLVVVGTISPDRSPSLYSMVEAGVQDVLVADGDLVEEGQLLVLLDPTEYKARLASAYKEAEVLRDLWKTAHGARERKKVLFAQKGTSATEMEKAEKSLRTAELDLDQAEAEVSRIENQIASCTVRAPAKGIVRDVIDKGWTRANPATELVKFEVIEPLWVEGSAHESYLPLLEPGMPVKVTISAYPGETFTGTLGPSTPEVNPQTRTGNIRVRLEESDVRLLPGMTARLRFDFQGEGAAIPRLALFNRLGREASVFRVRDGLAELVTVHLGRMDADWVEVAAGISSEDVIVQSGHLYLRDGDQVVEAN